MASKPGAGKLEVQVSFRESQDVVDRARQYARNPEYIKFTDFARKLFGIAFDLYEPNGGLRSLRDLRDRILAERQVKKTKEIYRPHEKSDRDKEKG